MSSSSKPNILKRRTTNTDFDTSKALSQNILEKSQYYHKIVKVSCQSYEKPEKSDCDYKEIVRVKRKRKNSPTSKKNIIDLDDVARVDNESVLSFKKPSILRKPQPIVISDATFELKSTFTEVEFLDEEVWNIGSDSEDPEPPPLEQTYLPRTVNDSFEWKSIKEINSEQTRRDPFIGKPGPVTDFMSPYEAFTAIWNHDVIEEIIKTSNKHGKEIHIERSKIKTKKYRQPWKDITLQEMYVYIAILMSTTNCKKRMFRNMFTTLPSINYTPVYKKHMHEDRFFTIHRALSFEENILDHDKLDYSEETVLRIKPLVNLLNESFSYLYNLHQNIVIEKVKNKKRTFRIFERIIALFDSNTGYCWQLSLFLDEAPNEKSLFQRFVERQHRNDDAKLTESDTSDTDSLNNLKVKRKKRRKNKTPKRKNKETEDMLVTNTAGLNQNNNLSATTSILEQDKPQDVIIEEEKRPDADLPPLSRTVPAAVLSLVRKLHFKGHTLFMDCFLQSLPLARTLKALGIDCVGSFRFDSQYAPKELQIHYEGKCELVPGQVLGFTTDDIDIIMWNERKLLTLLSTYHGLAMFRQTNLLAAVEYNFTMSVLDRFKKSMNELQFHTCRSHNFHGIFSYLLKISLINSYILYQSSIGSKKMNLNEFVDVVVEGLLEHNGASYKPLIVNVPPTLRHHLPQLRRKRKCAFCRTTSETSNCNGCHKYLCFPKCFRKYHEGIAEALEISSV